MFNRRRAMFSKLFNINYRVEHWTQNIFDDEYTLCNDFEMLCSAMAGEQVGDNYKGQPYAQERTGFKALKHNTSTPVVADGSTIIKIHYDRLYYLIDFDLGDDGFGVDPIYARYETPISQNLTPVRMGYIFTGWDPTLPTTMPAENTTYTACWEAGSSNVSVNLVFWYENANDNGYTYVNSLTYDVEYIEGKTVKPSDFQNVSFDGRDNYHFIFNASKNNEIMLRADGSTVVNIYFARKTYKLVFFNCTICATNKDTDACYPSSGVSALNIANNATGYNTIGDEHIYRIITDGAKSWNVDVYTFKWKQDVSSYWMNGIARREAGRRWRPYFDNCVSEETGVQIYHAGVGMMNVMPDSNIVFRFLSNGAYTCTMYYWVEPKLDETPTKTYEDRNYLQKYKFVCKFGDITETEEYVDIEGFTKVYEWSELISKGQITKGNDERTAHFYYARNSYPLTYISGGKIVKIAQVKFEDTLDGSTHNSEFIPNIPEGWDTSAYVFGGWYFSENCADGTRIDWNSDTMPVNGISIYAKWELVIHTVTIAGEGVVAQNFTVQHGKKVASAPENPNRDGYSFVSWFYVDENGDEIAFSFNMPITKDITVYPKWKEIVMTMHIDIQDE